MGHGSTLLRSGRRTPAGVLGLFVLFVLPLMILALLDILQGGENLVLEWTIVWIGILVIAAAQVATLSLLWWPRPRARLEVPASDRGSPIERMP